MLNLEKYRCNICGCLFDVVEDNSRQKYCFPEQVVPQKMSNTKCPSCESCDSECVLKDLFEKK